VPWCANGVAIAPDDQDFSRAAKWSLTIPASSWEGVEDQRNTTATCTPLFSRYTPADNFYDGRPWHGCLVRFRGTIMKNGLELETLPRRTNEPVFREKPYSSNGSGEKQILSLDSLSLAPLYRADIDF